MVMRSEREPVDVYALWRFLRYRRWPRVHFARIQAGVTAAAFTAGENGIRAGDRIVASWDAPREKRKDRDG